MADSEAQSPAPTKRKPPKLGPRKPSQQVTDGESMPAPKKLPPKKLPSETTESTSKPTPKKLPPKQDADVGEPKPAPIKSPPEQDADGQETKPDTKPKPKKLPPRKPSQQNVHRPPPAGENGEARDGEDLTTILTESQRSDLTILIADITASMRQLLLDNFDASAGLDPSLVNAGKETQNMTEDEKMMSANISADVGEIEAEKKKLAAYEKDLNSVQMVNLKKAALKAFDEWREECIARVGSAVNSEDTAEKAIRETKEKSEEGKEQAKPRADDSGKLGTIVAIPERSRKIEGTKFKDLYPPTKTSLTKLEMNKRTLVLHSMLLLSLSLEHYSAFSRTMLLNITSSLKLPVSTFEKDELTVAQGLLEAAKEMSATNELKKRAEENKETRAWRYKVAAVAGAAVIGYTGGMAAPLLATGVGSFMGGLGLGTTTAAGYLGSVAGSTYLVGGLFGAYGARMTGEMMENYSREVEDFEFLPVHSKKTERIKESAEHDEQATQASEHNHKLRVTICISGWLTEKEEVVKPWKVISNASDVFALKFELEALLNLGNSMNGMVQSAAWGYAQQQVIKQTMFADLMAAMWPIGVIKAARVIDNPFSVAKGRAEKAGEVLADALVNRAQGERPVTLISYSLGARVTYSALMSLAKRKAFGLVENVVMIGSPTPSDAHDWRMMRSVVSGRLVNVYSENDYVLGLMYRTSSVQYGIAGLQKVEGVPGVENVNVTEDVDGHLRYRFLTGSILKKIGWTDIDMKAVEEEAVELQKMLKQEEKESLRNQAKQLRRRNTSDGKFDEGKDAELEAGDIEKKVQASTEKSLATRVIEWYYTPSKLSQKDLEKAAGNLQKGLNNPSDAIGATTDTVDGLRTSTQSYGQWMYEHLPQIRSEKGLGKDATDIAKDPTKAAGKVTDAAKDPGKTLTDTGAGLKQTAQDTALNPTGSLGKATNTVKEVDPTKQSKTYVEYAASFLPDVRGGKKDSKPKDAAKDVTDAATGASKTVGDAAKKVPGAEAGKMAAEDTTKLVGDVVKTVPGGDASIKNAQDPRKTGDAAKGVTDAGTKAVGDATSKAADAGKSIPGADKATDTVKDTTDQATKAASGAASYIPGLGGSKKAETPKKPEANVATDSAKKATDTAKDAGDQATQTASSYSSYIPGFGGGKKKAETPSKTPADDTTTSAANVDKAIDPTKKATDTTSEAVKGAGNQATKTVSGVTSYIPGLGGRKASSPKKPPIVHQDSNRGKKNEHAKPQGDEKKDDKGTPKKTPSTSSKPETPASAKKAGYSSYLPSFGRSAKKSETPKAETPKAETPKAETPKSEIPKAGTPKAAPPKLDRKPSGIKSPREPARTPSSPKLDRKPSGVGGGVKSPSASTPKLDRLPSSINSPAVSTPKLDRKSSGMKSATSGVKSPGSSSPKPTSPRPLQERTPSSLNAVLSPNSKDKGGAISAGGDYLTKGAKTLTKTASGSVKQIPGAEVAGDAAKSAGDTAASGGGYAGAVSKDAVERLPGGKNVTDGVGKGGEAVVGAAGQGGKAVTEAAGAAKGGLSKVSGGWL